MFAIVATSILRVSTNNIDIPYNIKAVATALTIKYFKLVYRTLARALKAIMAQIGKDSNSSPRKMVIKSYQKQEPSCQAQSINPTRKTQNQKLRAFIVNLAYINVKKRIRRSINLRKQTTYQE